MPRFTRNGRRDRTRQRRIEAARQLGKAVDQRLRELDVEERAEALAEALITARDRVQELSTELGQRASRGGRVAARRSAEAARVALEQARAAAEHLPDRVEVGELTRRASDRLFRERARARRRAERRRMARLVGIGAGLAVAGMVIGWLTAPRRGPAADQLGRLRGGDPLTPLDMRAEGEAPADVALVTASGNGTGTHRND